MAVECCINLAAANSYEYRRLPLCQCAFGDLLIIFISETNVAYLLDFRQTHTANI